MQIMYLTGLAEQQGVHVLVQIVYIIIVDWDYQREV